MATQVRLGRPPVTSEELWHLVHALWNVKLPHSQVCDEHQSPFTAFSEAFFAHDPNWSLWYGSRGTGKSYMLALLALTKAAVLDVNVTLLGGSMAQSINVREHVDKLLRAPNAPRYALAKPPTATEVQFSHGNWIRPIPASQTTVRGPHPTLTCLDEIDEMEWAIYKAAQGQAMALPNAYGEVVPEMTVASSTWQNPAGTFFKVITDARDKGLPVRTWCYKEVLRTADTPDGWMAEEFIERKRLTVPAEMFKIEYELGEPSGESLAFDIGSLNDCVVDVEPVVADVSDHDSRFVYEQPVKHGAYAAGADWAKEKDFTVFTVVRTDVAPWRVVYVRKLNRRPWPYMIGQFNNLVNRYQAVSAHDATGLGNVVNDLVDARTSKVVMVGRDRTKLLTEYINAVERGAYALPAKGPLVPALRTVTVGEVFGSGDWKSHLADEMASAAIAHRAAARQAQPTYGSIVEREGETRTKWMRHVDGATRKDSAEWVSEVMGEVTVVDEDPQVGVVWL